MLRFLFKKLKVLFALKEGKQPDILLCKIANGLVKINAADRLHTNTIQQEYA
jgi:hypothetical protein